jgi:preprotein translocase SecE subunit
MARHRQRARDRKRQEEGNSGEIHHENVSGELEKISGEVEEFDASLIQGADGEPEPIDEEELAAIEEASVPADDPDVEEARRPHATGPKPGGNRVLNFLRASWAELQRVQWPDRRQVAQATAVVLGFVAIAGAYLGLADAAAQKIVDYII